MKNKFNELGVQSDLAMRVGSLFGQLMKTHDSREVEITSVMRNALDNIHGSWDEKLNTANRAVLDYVERNYPDLYRTSPIPP